MNNFFIVGIALAMVGVFYAPYAVVNPISSGAVALMFLLTPPALFVGFFVNPWMGLYHLLRMSVLVVGLGGTVYSLRSLGGIHSVIGFIATLFYMVAVAAIAERIRLKQENK